FKKATRVWEAGSSCSCRFQSPRYSRSAISPKHKSSALLIDDLSVMHAEHHFLNSSKLYSGHEKSLKTDFLTIGSFPYSAINFATRSATRGSLTVKSAL